MGKIITVDLISERKLGVSIAHGERFWDALERVKGCHERRYAHGVWEVALTSNNVGYLLRAFTREEMELTPQAQLALDYTQQTEQLAALKQARRWEYLFDDKVPEVAYEFHTPPYRHQQVALDAVHQSEFFALFMEMGTGKTKVVIDEAVWMARDNPGKQHRVLIVVPRSLISNWLNEINKHTAGDPLPSPRGILLKENLWAGRLATGINGLELLLAGVKSEKPLQFYVINYDKLQAMQDALSTVRFDLMVLDESTRIKNPSAKRTKYATALGVTASRRIILSGAPVLNNVHDLFAQCTFLQRGILGYDTYFSFKGHYERLEDVKGQRRYAHLDELKERMALFAFVVKKERCLDLPSKVYTTVTVEMTEEQQKLYDEMEQYLVASLSAEQTQGNTVTATISLVKLLRLAQICNGFFKTMDGTHNSIPGGNPKVDALRDIMEDVDGKVIVWARFIYDHEQVMQALSAYNPVLINGSVGEADRDEAVRRFNEDEDCRVLVGEPSTGGIGLNLFGTERSPCKTVVYYSNDFSLEKRVQSEDRCHRAGMKHDQPVTYIDIACERSIDLRIAEILQSKRDLSEAIKDLKSIREHLLRRE